MTRKPVVGDSVLLVNWRVYPDLNGVIGSVAEVGEEQIMVAVPCRDHLVRLPFREPHRQLFVLLDSDDTVVVEP